MTSPRRTHRGTLTTLSRARAQSMPCAALCKAPPPRTSATKPQRTPPLFWDRGRRVWVCGRGRAWRVRGLTVLLVPGGTGADGRQGGWPGLGERGSEGSEAGGEGLGPFPGAAESQVGSAAAVGESRRRREGSGSGRYRSRSKLVARRAQRDYDGALVEGPGSRVTEPGPRVAVMKSPTAMTRGPRRRARGGRRLAGSGC
jgi:hypothetical protein